MKEELKRENPNKDIKKVNSFLSPNVVFCLVSHNRKYVLNIYPVCEVVLVSSDPVAIAIPILKGETALQNVSSSKRFTLNLIPKMYIKDVFNCFGEWENKNQSNIFLTRFKVQHAFYIVEYKVGTENKSFPWLECRVKEVKKMIGYDSSLVIADVVHLSDIEISIKDKIMVSGRKRTEVYEIKRSRE